MNHYIRLRSENVVVKSLFVHPALFGYFTAFVSLLLLARYVVTRQLRWLALSVSRRLARSCLPAAGQSWRWPRGAGGRGGVAQPVRELARLLAHLDPGRDQRGGAVPRLPVVC